MTYSIVRLGKKQNWTLADIKTPEEMLLQICPCVVKKLYVFLSIID